MEGKSPTMPSAVFLKCLKVTGSGSDSQERQLHRNHEKLLKEQLKYPCHVVLGIGEHSIHRGGARGHKFAVTLANLRNHRIYEVFEGKGLATLEPNLRRLRGREKVNVVCMDLCPTFRSIVQRLFPNAKIVADRFHVIRLMLKTFLEFSCAADPDIRRKRGVTRELRTKGEKPCSCCTKPRRYSKSRGVRYGNGSSLSSGCVA